MPALVRPPKPIRTTDEERKAAAHKIRHRWLSDTADWAVSRLDQPEAWRSFLWTAAMHPAYSSVTNWALVSVQAPGEVTGTDEMWKRCLRTVREDQHGHGHLMYARHHRTTRPGTHTALDMCYSRRHTRNLHAFSEDETTDPEPPYARTPEELTIATKDVLSRLKLSYDPSVTHRDAMEAAAFHLHAPDAPSAAYVAAVMVGAEPGTPPPPPVPKSEDREARADELRAAAGAVWRQGRKLASIWARYCVPPF